MDIPCKTIDVPGNVNGMDTDSQQGLLAYLGYSGAAHGPGVGMRRKILQDAFCAELVPLTNQNKGYILEFGPPASGKRFLKIYNYLDGRIRDAEHRPGQAWLDVLGRYEEDYFWFVNTFATIAGVEVG